jgi:hypothetical protein
MNVLLLRFNESSDDDLIRPTDSEGNLDELVNSGAAMPAIAEAAVGFGRAFVSADGDGLTAQDIDSGSTLLTRDMTIQVIMSWDIEAAAIYAGGPFSPTQTIYARGDGTSSAEYCNAGLELRVVSAASRIGEVRWLWHDLSGVLHTQIGGHFQVPEDGFLMLTASRRWVDSTRVVLRYYLGDTLLAEVESADGEIGGGTTGTTQIGTRYDASNVMFYWNLDGVIDELRVTDDELTAEEVAATYKRITVDQPNGYRLLRDMHDPGFPISEEPDSRAQKETRLWGNALGYAAAQADNIRENILPDKAYGRVLERWESITKSARRPSDDVDKRRDRVVGRIRAKRGVSIPGVGDAIGELLDTDPANLEIVAFDQTTVDTWEDLNALRWRHDPEVQWTISANALRVQSAGTRTAYHDWYTSLMSIGGDGRGAAILSKATVATLNAGAEVGVMFANRSINGAVLLGIRNDLGTYRIVRESVELGSTQGATVLATLGGVVPAWFVLDQDPDNLGDFRARWSVVGAEGPFDEATFTVAELEEFHWAGHYARTHLGAANIDVSFDDTSVRAPFGVRSFHFYVYRDPTIPGAPDFLGANAVLRGLKQSHTHARAVNTLEALYDDESTTYDSEPMGGI